MGLTNSPEGSIHLLSNGGDMPLGTVPSTIWSNCPWHSRGLSSDQTPDRGCSSSCLGLQAVPRPSHGAWGRETASLPIGDVRW